MEELRKEILAALDEDKLFQYFNKKTITNKECNRTEILSELVELHNNGLVDLIAVFKTLHNTSDTAYQFFQNRYILEQILPVLDAQVQDVMGCVSHLIQQADRDLAARTIVRPFIAFCERDPQRLEQALALIENHTDEFADLLVEVVVASAKFNIDYVDRAIQLTLHPSIDIRIRALIALGQIQYNSHPHLVERIFLSLEYSAEIEHEDKVLGGILDSTCRLVNYEALSPKRVNSLMTSVLAKGGDYTLHAAANLLSDGSITLPNFMANSLLLNLLRVKPESNGTLGVIDAGLVQLFAREARIDTALNFLEKLLLAHPERISFEVFSGVIHETSRNQTLLSKMLTRWFHRGEIVLCEAISTIISHIHDHNMVLSIDPSEMDCQEFINVIFVARKTLGYLFTQPTTAASILVSLITYCGDDEASNYLAHLLFDPLLINYPGKVKKYLTQCTESDNKRLRESVSLAIKMFDEYWDTLQSTEGIVELHPSQSQRDTYHKHFSQKMSASMKEAESKSAILSLVARSVILYGIKSIDYVHDAEGEAHRTEMLLHSHGAELELPRLLNIDPFGLDFMLRVYRVEQKNETSD